MVGIWLVIILYEGNYMTTQDPFISIFKFGILYLSLDFCVPCHFDIHTLIWFVSYYKNTGIDILAYISYEMFKIDVITCLAIWLCLTAIGNKATTCTTSCNLRLRDSWQGHYMALTSKNNCILRRNIIDMYVIISYCEIFIFSQHDCIFNQRNR